MKVLIIGLGSIAHKHINSLKKINKEVEIYALRSKHNSKNRKEVINLYSFSELNDYTFTFCIISSPTFKHEKDIQNIIDLNIPLFIEKPLSNTLSIEKLIKPINDKKIKTYIACNLRFLESLQYVKEHYIDKNYRINEANAYCGSFLPDWRENKDYKNNYSALPEMGGGVHLDLIHELDYFYWMFGKPTFSQNILKSQSSLDIKSIDYANYQLDYGKFVGNIVLNYYRKDAKRDFEIVFENFTIKVDILKNKVYKNGKVVFETKQKPIDTYDTQMNFFLDYIENKKPLFNSIEEALQVLQICLINKK